MEVATILVAESDPSLRCWLADRISQSGRRVICVESADGALSVLASRRADVMVLGQLAGDRGASLLALALPKAPGMTALVVSPDPSVQAGVEAMKLGAIDFLVDPLAPEAFDPALERAIAMGRTRRSVVELGAQQDRNVLLGGSKATRRVREMSDQLARSDRTVVLLQGETGTGKEVVAQAIHVRSARAERPFLKLNCAALPEMLFESELFGHEKGAFTTAHERRVGIFEAAQGGTVLLDEMGDLQASGQAKLLRLLEQKTFRRVGGLEEMNADVRVIASTHVDLEAQVAAGHFRADLFFRLNVVRVHVAPLRERREDIPVLASSFVARFNEQMGREVRGIAHEAIESLEAHDWPGNVRELRNMIERAFILYPGMQELRPEHLPLDVRQCQQRREAARAPQLASLQLPDAERRLLQDVIRRTGGNQSQAARVLGITRRTLGYRLRKYNIRSRTFGSPGATAASS